MAVAMVLGRDRGWERSRGAGGDSEHGQGAASQQSQQWSINCSGNCSSRMGMHGAEQEGKRESRGIHCICTKSLCFLGVFNDFYAAVSEVKPVLHIHWHGPQHLLLSGHSELHVRPEASPHHQARELRLPWVGEPCPSAACVWPLRPVTNGPAQPVPAPAAGGFHPRQECQLNFDFLGVAYPRAQL